MILIDQFEDPLYGTYLSGCVEYERGAFNKTGGSSLVYPDFTLLNGGRVLGVNAKQAGECLSSLDAVEAQLAMEIAGPIDGLHLMIRGMVIPTDLNQCEAVSFDEDGHCHHGRTFAQNYVGYLAWLSRLDEMGVTVVSLPNIKASASYLVALHNNLGKTEHKTFRRLLPTKQMIADMDHELRARALFLMGIPGVGEQVAVCLATQFPNLASMMGWMGEGGKLSEFTYLTNGKTGRVQKVGPAIDAKIRMFMGITPDRGQTKARER